jgi:hypothetical protein
VLSAAHLGRKFYTLEEFGLTRAEIRDGLSDLFDRFEWGAPPRTDV